MAQTDEEILARTVELSGLGRGTMPVSLLNNLMITVTTSETRLAQVLAQTHPLTD